MISYSKQFISNKDIEAVKKVLKSNYLTQGTKVPIFEKKIRKYVGAKYATAVSSASAALHLSCIALGLKKNDYLWTVPNTFIASATCGLHCGAKIDFVDINENDHNISIAELEKKLKIAKKKKKLPKILVTVHFSGLPVNQDKIYILSKKYGFKILEDASHALGAKYKTEKVGSCKWSDMTVFSFHPVKPITTAEGGVITTNNKKYFEQVAKLRTHGITKNLSDLKKKIKKKWYYEFQNLGFNYRMSEIHAALGISQLDKLDKFLIKRNKLALRYLKKMKLLNFILPSKDIYKYSTFHLFVIKIDFSKIKLSYDKIFDKLISKGLHVNLHYLPVHLHPYFKKLGFKNGDFPVSEKYSKCAISIPIYYQMNNRTQDKVINVFKKISDTNTVR
jgi:UDP-4-amino-4,6-dideoxy-N-acetyl-beta-L-altrosamine transaminase